MNFFISPQLYNTVNYYFGLDCNTAWMMLQSKSIQNHWIGCGSVYFHLIRPTSKCVPVSSSPDSSDREILNSELAIPAQFYSSLLVAEQLKWMYQILITFHCFVDKFLSDRSSYQLTKSKRSKPERMKCWAISQGLTRAVKCYCFQYSYKMTNNRSKSLIPQ